MKGKKPSEIECQPQPDFAKLPISINYTLKSISAGNMRKTEGVWKWEICGDPESEAISLMVAGIQNDFGSQKAKL